MATSAQTAKLLKLKKSGKFSTKVYNRCKECGRPRAYIRDVGLCRICFRNEARKGTLPGIKKASW